MKRIHLMLLCCAWQTMMHAQTMQLINNKPNENYAGQHNTIYGNGAGNPGSSDASQFNLLLGYQAGNALTKGEQNTVLGASAGASLTTGNSNILVGRQAGSGITTASNNIVFGRVPCQTCRNSIIMGWTGGTAVNLYENVIIGYGDFVNKSQNWERNVILGYNAAGIQADNLQYSVIIGASAGSLAKFGGIMIGNLAGSSNKGRNVIFIGPNAGQENIGNNNLYIGNQAGEKANASECIIIGHHAVRPNDEGIHSISEESIFIGHKSGQYDVKSIGSTYVGFHSGTNFVKGRGNTFIGKNAGYEPPGTITAESGGEGDYNVFLGLNAGSQVVSVNDNVFLGSLAGEKIKEGKGNVFIGKASGNQLIDHSEDVILLGANTQVEEGIINAVGIGADARVRENNSFIISPSLNVGIGTEAPRNKVEIVSQQPNSSGLRLTNLTASSPTAIATSKVLTVNDVGDIILTELPTNLKISTDQIQSLLTRIANLETENSALKTELSAFAENIDNLSLKLENVERNQESMLNKKQKEKGK